LFVLAHEGRSNGLGQLEAADLVTGSVGKDRLLDIFDRARHVVS
jgi:hypothetical protein